MYIIFSISSLSKGGIYNPARRGSHKAKVVRLPSIGFIEIKGLFIGRWGI